MNAVAARGTLRVAIAVFAFVAIYYLVYPVWRMQFPLEIWPTEGWNAYHQDTAARLATIYPPADSLLGNNYPPLSFYFIGALTHLFGDALFVGRVVSLLALLVIAVEITCCAVLLGASGATALLGALWFIGFMAHNSLNYVGANDPQLLAQAIMTGGFALFLRTQRDGTSPTASLLVMVLAGFFKHNVFMMPLSAIVWLIATRRSGAVRPVAIAVASVLGALAACAIVFGQDFVLDMMPPRNTGWRLIIPHLGHLQWHAAAFLFCLAWIICARDRGSARMLALLIGSGLASCLAQWSGDGVAQNAEFDFIIALAISLGVVLADPSPLARRLHVAPERLRDGMVIVLLLRLILSSRQESAWVLFDPAFRARFAEAAVIARNEAARSGAVDGQLFCDSKLVCRAGGKSFVVDEFKVEQLIATGRMSPAELDKRLAAGSISRFAADPRTIVYNLAYNPRMK